MAVTQEIRIVVSETGSRVVKRELGGIGTSAKSSGTAVDFLKRQLRLLGGAFLVKEVIELSDEFINLRNRIRTVVPGFDLAKVALDEVFEVANRTRSSVAATGETFARIAVSGKTFGLSIAGSLRLVESINQAIILSGASAREAKTGLIQLSQGFARGVLRGDELRSVLEQMPVVADVIAEHLKVSRFEIAKLGEKGVITTRVMIDAFDEADQKLAKAFLNTVPTISQSFEILRNHVIQLIGKFNENTGAAVSLAKGVIFLAEHLDEVVRVATILGILLARGAVFAGLTKAVGPVLFLARAIQLLSVSFSAGGIVGAATTLRTIGSAGVAAFGGWPVLILAAVAALALFSDKITVFQDSGATLKDTFLGAFDVIDKETRRFFNHFVELANLSYKEMGTSLVNSFIGSLDTIKAFIPGAAILKPFLPQQQPLEGPPEPSFTQKLEQAAARRVKLREEEAKRVTALRKKLEEQAVAQQRANQLTAAEVKLGYDIAKLEEQASAFGIRDLKQREVALAIAQEEYRLRVKFADLGQKAKNAFVTAFKNRQEAEEYAKAVDAATAPTRELADGTRILTRLFAEGYINLKQYNEQLNELKTKTLEASGTVKDGFKAGLLDVQKQFTDTFSLARDTVTNAFQSMEDALVKFVETGKFNFSDLIRSILADVTKLVVRKTITAPLAGLLGLDEKGGLKFNGFGAANPGGGGIFSELLGAVKGAAGLFSGAASGGGGILGSILSVGKGLLGFADGGDFTVGGSGGTDSKVVAFKATPGEKVSVRRPGDDGKGQAPIVVNYYITTQNADSFKRSQGQILSKTASALGRARAKNG